MSIHDSPFGLKEAGEVMELQERLSFMQRMINSMEDEEELDPEFTIDFLHTLYALVEKQLIVIIRLQLSEDEVDKVMLQQLNEEAKEEMREYDTLYEYLINRKQEIKEKITELTGEDLDESVDLS